MRQNYAFFSSLLVSPKPSVSLASDRIETTPQLAHPGGRVILLAWTQVEKPELSARPNTSVVS